MAKGTKSFGSQLPLGLMNLLCTFSFCVRKCGRRESTCDSKCMRNIVSILFTFLKGPCRFDNKTGSHSDKHISILNTKYMYLL